MEFDSKRFSEVSRITKVHIQKGRIERRRWDKWTSWYLSEFWSQAQDGDNLPAHIEEQSEQELTLETNYPFAYLDTMVANVVPNNPRVVVWPLEPDLREVAKARQALINDTLRVEKLQKKLRETALRAGICGRGFAKTIWNKDRRRPSVRVIDPRRLFYDQSADWDDIRYIIEAIPYTEAEFKKKLALPGEEPNKDRPYLHEGGENYSATSQPEWMYDTLNRASREDASVEAFRWVIVYEYYDLVDGVVYHFLEGRDTPLYAGPLPYKYVKHPYTLLTFNSNLRDTGGLSDVALIERAQERLNEIDTLELWFAHQSIPVPIVNEELLDNPEEARNAFSECNGPGKAWFLKAKSQFPLDQIITFTRSPGLVPSFPAMRERATQIIEFTLGLPQYQRGVAGTSAVATDLALVNSATQTRNGRRVSIVRDFIMDVGMKVLALWKQYIPSARGRLVRQNEFDEALEVNRENLAFPMPGMESSEAEDDWAFEIEAALDNPSENNRMMMLQKFQQFLSVMLQDPNFDHYNVARRLAELLELDDIVSSQRPQPVAMPGLPNVPGSQVSADTTAGGALPEGLDSQAMLPPDAYGQASQPK